MLATLIQRKRSAIAFDFGACSLRAVQLARTGSRWRIHHWVNVEHEPSNADGPSPDHAAELRMLLGPGTFSGRECMLVLSPPEVEYKLLDMPAALLGQPSEELRDVLQFELDRQMPWPTSESEIGVWPVDPAATGTTSAMIVAGRSACIRQHLDTLDVHGLDCLRADVSPNAMLRVASAESNGESATVRGFLDLGFTSNRLYLVSGERCVYARVLRGGGRETTDVLCKALHVDFHIAEQYKRIYGVRMTDRGFRSMVGGLARISEDALPSVLFSILRPTIEGIVGEIEKSYRFVLGKSPGATAGALHLIGGGARLHGIVEVLQSLLGLPIRVATPPAHLITGDCDQPHPACTPANYCVLAPCVGLALTEDTA